MLIQLTIFIVGLLGAALLSYGAWLVYPPAGLLTSGALAMIWSAMMSRAVALQKQEAKRKREAG
ncbi:hypothetical protein [Pseudaeromonas paramecii]|uniref:Uncharacterized protein n=1 Tax=Pseudaeromonas paramecii TaxID=2138166 RepID=A0ABP8PU53_9GAMM